MLSVSGIRKILNKYDLEALIKLGAPEDEYEQEAVMISEWIYPRITREALAECVRDVFTRQFGLGPYPYSTLLSIATEILDDTPADS